ncbi:DUF2889 domain-containing protein [Marinobacterium sp. MBR-109]|jgi:hypothetical protein|uniref:DUF2889 domain-containing protein n=1 Tax=Marinobacterium sp. MBR-109 TaxID=3156462 RepID=UPI0033947A06
MPLPPAEDRELLHTRYITCKGYRRHDGLWDVEGELVDLKSFDLQVIERNDGIIPTGEPLHKMALRLTVDYDLLIHDVQASMDYTPFKHCPSIADNFRRLIGHRIAPGFTRLTRDLLGGTQGCTHLLEMLGTMATTAYQTTHQEREKREDFGIGGETPPPTLNTCHSFDTNGPVVQNYWPQFYTGDQPGDEKDTPHS